MGDRAKGFSLACVFLLFVFVCETIIAESVLEIEAKLPLLPEGIFDAADILLTPNRGIADVNIEGFRKTESERWGVEFRQPELQDEPSSLDKEGARLLADCFLDQYFPSLKDSKKFRGCGTYRTSGSVSGYTVRYDCEHRNIPVLNDRILVTVRREEVVGAKIIVHSAQEIGKKQKLLSVEDFLLKVESFFGNRFSNNEPVIIKHLIFGYFGGFVQHWEYDRRNWWEPFEAVPVYKVGFVSGRSRGMGMEYVFDARSAELLYPKEAEGKGTVEITGPELIFSEAGVKRLFLIGPRDVEIKNAVFELENVPIEDSWRVYRARDLLIEREGWGFTDCAYPERGFISLNGTHQGSGKAVGRFSIETAGSYEMEVLLYQGKPGDFARAIQVTLNNESRIMGMQGPDTFRAWEQWGVINLAQGEHEIVFVPAPESIGSWEIGGIRLKHAVDAKNNIRGVEEFSVSIGKRGRPDYSNSSPPIGLFMTKNLSSRVGSGLKRGFSVDRIDRNILCISMAAGNPCIIRLQSLGISFLATDQIVAAKKAKQFVMVYPESGDCSRSLCEEESVLLCSYVNQITGSKRRPRLSLSDRLDLCKSALDIAGQYGFKHDSLAGLKAGYLELVEQEIGVLGNSLFLYDTDRPPPVEYVKGWNRKLLWYRDMFDENRIVDNSTYLDPWSNPYVLQFLPQRNRICIYSFGPNGKDDSGSSDDIRVETNLSLLRF